LHGAKTSHTFELFVSDSIDVGDELRRARQEREETVRDVEFHIRIPARIIRNLEQNDYTHFASPTYAKSYLKQYSEYLEVNADFWLKAFDTSGAASHLDAFSHLDGAGKDYTTPVAKPQKGTRKQHSRTAIDTISHDNTFSALLAVIVCAAVIGGGFTLYRFFENQLDEPEVVLTQDVPSQEIVIEEPEEALAAKPEVSQPVEILSPVLPPPVAEVIDEEALFAELLGAQAGNTLPQEGSLTESEVDDALRSEQVNSQPQPSE